MANLSKERQQALLKILHYIQDGGDFTEAKKMFQESFDKVDVSEITAAERELIAQGLDPRKIQYLCNVHADVFKGNIKENAANPDFATPGHPVNTLKQENVVIKSLVNDYLLPNLKKWEKDHSEQTLSKIKQALSDLATIGKHYARKETSFFPLMTKYGITAPPQVMWGVDDKIRRLIKEANNVVNENDVDPAKLRKIIDEVSHEVLEMIFKEEEIMVPMIDEVASPADWGNVKDEEKQIGYTLINPPMNWKPKEEPKTAGPLSVDHLSSLFINFKEGALNLEQLSAILDLLPFALTFVDENDKVAYFGGGAAIFPHSKNAIGNSVFSCHTPESKPIVEKIFQDLHSGEKKVVTYWFKPKMLGRMLYLRYYAVHNKDGKYLG
ncbi:DUF438 domain-containing protein, partial [Lactobacillus acidophilus]